MKKNNIGAIVLAAGKGKRMKSKNSNKVVLSLGNKPMILHTIELLKKLQIKDIVVVVGFAKQSVIKILGNQVIFAEQKKRLGTAHAVSCALKKMPKNVENVLVLNGDDSAFYDKKTIEGLAEDHILSNASFTFLTIEKENPLGLGRVIRDKNDKVIAIVEEKDANDQQKKINEVNPACYIFKVNFLKKYLSKVKKSKITGEYYLTSLIGLGIRNGEKIETVRVGNFVWRGVNTKEELQEAEELFLSNRS